LLSFLRRGWSAMMARFWGGVEDWHQIQRLFGMLLRYKGLIGVALVCMVGYNLFNALPAWYVKDVVDSLQKGRVPDLTKFTLVGVGIFLIFFAKGVFYFGHNYLLGKATQRMIHGLRSRLYAHLQTLSFSFFSNRPAGDLISRFTADLVTLQDSVRMIVLGPLRDVPQIFVFLAILLYRSWQLFLFSLVIIPIALVLIQRFGKRTKRLTTQRLASFGEMTTVLHETINGIRVVKAFSMEGYERGRFERANADVLHRYNRTIRIMSYSQPMLETIGALAGAGIIMFGGYLILHQHITPGDFVSFLLAFFMLNDPIRKLNSFGMQLQEGMAAASRVYELLDIEPEEVDAPDARPLRPIREALRIQVERFAYTGAGGKAALTDIDLEVKAGQVVALVGPSGAGKTTLVNLIPRFFNLREGAIRIDGVDTREGTVASLRGQIAIVTQEIFLFNDTVANNIAYGNPACPREEIVAAATAAYADTFIRALPKGYDTLIGEGGIHLSGGHRPCADQERADPDPGRGHLRAGLRVGAGGAESHRGPDPEPHHDRHRAPPLHHQPRGPDLRDGEGAHRGTRGTRRAAAQGRAVQAALRDAVPRCAHARRRGPLPLAAPHRPRHAPRRQERGRPGLIQGRGRYPSRWLPSLNRTRW
jgi:subfamily B ATP-binding cassette protein MsbA